MTSPIPVALGSGALDRAGMVYDADLNLAAIWGAGDRLWFGQLIEDPYRRWGWFT